MGGEFYDYTVKLAGGTVTLSTYEFTIGTSGNTIKIDSSNNTIKIDGSNNTVKTQPVGTWSNTEVLSALAVDDTDDHFSSSVDMAGKSAAMIQLAITVAQNTPTSMQVWLQVSDDDSAWFDYTLNPWNALVWEDAAAPYAEALPLPVNVGRYVRLKVVGTGCDGTNRFALTADINVRT